MAAELTADGVFSGGGIKGLAFAGALVAAKEHGYVHWHELAGTSAGAITAMALAVGYDADELNATLESFDFSALADYGTPIHLLGAIKDLIFRESIVRGDALSTWIEGLLAAKLSAAATFGELPGGRTLVVVGTDVAHSRMVVFPRDVALYQDEHGEPLVPEEFPIAKAVRISASYPYFFPPVGGLWDRTTEKEGVFVDGGVTSAFPVFAFDRRSPAHPTWGFHLHSGFDEQENQPTHRGIGGPTWPVEMLAGILDSSTNALDKFSEEKFGPRVIAIPTGAVSTLNFDLTAEDRQYLYTSGYDAAERFFAAAPAPVNIYGEAPAAAN
jgi:NTE family protein